MKRIIALLLAAIMTVLFAACGNTNSGSTPDTADTTSSASAKESSKPKEITVTCLDGNGETTEVTVPYNPERVAVVDFASLDILDNLGLGDRVVGSANVTLDYLSSYNDNENVTNIGTIKEADMEAIMECEPEIIFMSGRMSDSYDALSELAPVVRLTTDAELGLVESVRRNAKTIASIFGLEEDVDAKMADFDNRIATLSEFAKDKTALVGMFSGGTFNLLGNDGRCSIIGTEIGFENLGISAASERSSGSGSHSHGNSESSGSGTRGTETKTATHGNETSFEFIVAADADYIFVMNRDAAIGADGADLAKDVIENELVKETRAYKDGNIVYLENPGVWYTAEGGITALDIMLKDLESALLGE